MGYRTYSISPAELCACRTGIIDGRSWNAEVGKYPIGTLANYGPDDKTITKIVAAVIPYQGAEPILEKWVGIDVKDDSRVAMKIKAFFTSHGVKHVGTYENCIGCPHSEVEEFPVDEDCPLCPWWVGKQRALGPE